MNAVGYYGGWQSPSITSKTDRRVERRACPPFENRAVGFDTGVDWRRRGKDGEAGRLNHQGYAASVQGRLLPTTTQGVPYWRRLPSAREGGASAGGGEP